MLDQEGNPTGVLDNAMNSSDSVFAEPAENEIALSLEASVEEAFTEFRYYLCT